MRPNAKSGRKKEGFLHALLALLYVSLTVISGCSGEQAQTGSDSVSVFYINKAETKITPVAHPLKGTALAEQIEEAVTALEENPVELSLRTPVNGYTIQGWTLKDTQLIIDLSEEYLKMQPTTEVLVRAAIVRTMTQLEGVEYVVMTVNGEALADSLGIVVGPMTADMFIDNAGNEFNSYEKVRLKLYFANETGDKLVETFFPEVYSSNISMEKLVVEKLVAGPGKDVTDAFPVINPATKVISVTVKDGTCYVNFDDNFMTQIYNVTGEVVIYSIANSLVELPNVNKVQIAVNGETDIIYRESFNLSTVFERNLDLVYKSGEEAYAGKNES